MSTRITLGDLCEAIPSTSRVTAGWRPGERFHLTVQEFVGGRWATLSTFYGDTPEEAMRAAYRHFCRH